MRPKIVPRCNGPASCLLGKMRGTHEVHTAVPRRNNYAVQPASVRSTAPVPKWSGAERRAALKTGTQSAGLYQLLMVIASVKMFTSSTVELASDCDRIHKGPAVRAYRLPAGI